ncbi:Asp-tRNA(Asn)/Glu-tRNA(Gln) amidotransferase subunit GatB [Candidatus Omnitrophota bacterium]
MGYETVIGLEVHLHLNTKTKAFCGCSTEFGKDPNSQTCPICLGMPGVLPVLNEEAFYFAIKVALALNCKARSFIKFDRKNYYYPDLPKNYQISQYDMPLSFDGHLEIGAGSSEKKTIRIKRVHLEEDAGKLIHDTKGDYSLVDLNRAGIPLLEIVSEPDINSPQEAYDYLAALKSILEYLEVSDCDMEKGSLRCDANVSVRKAGEKALGEKVELKNMNSFKGVRSALEYERERQIEAVGSHEKIRQETRLWDADKGITMPMRTKEEAHDYRYFPEPDLVPFVVDEKRIEEIRGSLPELPAKKNKRFMEDFGLSEYDAGVLTSRKDMAVFFEACAGIYKNAKVAANWIMGDIANHMNIKKTGIKGLGIAPEGVAGLLKMIDSGAISGKIAKEVLTEMIETKRTPMDIVSAKGLTQISDKDELETVAGSVIDSNPKTVEDYRSGKKAALAFLVGQVMKRTKGRANPKFVNEILAKKLGE